MESKLRILHFLRYLTENTDEGQAVTNSDIRAHYAALGEKVSMPTIRDDVRSLREAGYDIDVREVNGVATYYRFLDRQWSAPELQILVDAVSAGQFLSAKKTRKIIKALKEMAGPTEREQLEPGIRVQDRVKAPNEQILYIVQDIRDAIQQDRQISFQHYEYDPSLKKVPKHEGYRYVVSPYAMIWKRDRYYLIGWSEKHGRVAHFRIDRMGKPRLLDRPRVPMPGEFRLEDRTDRIFSMFDGPEETVILKLRPHLISQVVDQFGDAVEVLCRRENRMDVRVKVHLSPTFYGWLFQYVGEMTVISPEYVCEEYARKMQAGIDEVLGE